VDDEVGQPDAVQLSAKRDRHVAEHRRERKFSRFRPGVAAYGKDAKCKVNLTSNTLSGRSSTHSISRTLHVHGYSHTARWKPWRANGSAAFVTLQLVTANLSNAISHVHDRVSGVGRSP